jgi:capsule biosynthesis phosphatase
LRICIDLDGTICEHRGPNDDYGSVRPLPHAAETIRAWRAQGHFVIISTARHMKTTQGNVGLAVARQGATLFQWLERHGIEFDEVHFGKPYADIYIDDNAVRFDGNWADIERRLPRASAEHDGGINFVVTMAGAGARFRDAGFNLPKPMIPAFGEPMYRHAVRSLPLERTATLVFLIPEDEHSSAISDDIEETFGTFEPAIVRVSSLTRGQAETMLLAEPHIAFNKPLLVQGADSAFVCTDFGEATKAEDGALPVFQSNLTRWSYAAVDAAGKVTQIREKKVISSNACAGAYYFRSSIQAMELARGAIARNDLERGEFYVAPLYNRMIDAGQRISLINVERFVSYGTPDDLAEAEADPENGRAMAVLRAAAESAAASYRQRPSMRP